DFNELVTVKSVFQQMVEHLLLETAPESQEQQLQEQQSYAIACANGGEPLQVVCAAPGPSRFPRPLPCPNLSNFLRFLDGVTSAASAIRSYDRASVWNKRRLAVGRTRV